MSLEGSRPAKRNGALFITYDGLLDPLGGSQILPYLYNIAEHTRPLHVVSFEKPDRFREEAGTLREELGDKGIHWTPLSFTAGFGMVGKAWDLMKMYGSALGLQLRYRFGLAHCRSYQAMQVGCFLHRLTGVKNIFDMRGLWVDERVEGNLWPQSKYRYRLLYWYYKRVERRLLECADSVVVLTERVVPEIYKLAPGTNAPITVIPCCADFEHFKSLAADERTSIRSELDIAPDTIVLSYLGSLGTIYLLDDMLRLFKTIAMGRDDVCLLLITRDWSDAQEANLVRLEMRDLRDRIYVRAASRKEVPKLLGISDIMLSFRRSTYSQMACSPTKLAEAFALGIPAISNSGVGDVDRITHDLDAGMLIDLEAPNAYRMVSDELDRISAKGGDRLRRAAHERLGLENAKHAYREIYEQLGVQG
ncbi:glycosyltransferase [Spiribacter sp. 2438]|uniref:glycosyltransferase n=1 Tax=Spiribacter sp. 2438 TaxID=2666185 RepID=UPI0012B0673E|nr:glycosyltransferase [Spiribacter sp. 2438]QGM22376.1 glycosyltransferase [Spiribacter sp. 2438]